jgi:hypothetical protein
MAIQKQASMKKAAGESFKFYRVPAPIENEIGQDGRPTGKKVQRVLKRVEGLDQYVYEDTGKPYAGSVTSETPTVKRAVSGPELMDKLSNPLYSRILSCQKSQKLVEQLRKAAETSHSGIVNFVIGNDTIGAEAI